MKFKRDSGLLSLGRHAAWMILATLPVAPSMAATELQIWHDLSPHNSDSFEGLVKIYNRSQSDIRVTLRRFGHPADLQLALDDAAKKKQLPALVEMGDSQTLDEIAKRPYIEPFYTLLKSPELKDVKWFVASDNAFVHDAKGRLMAFPYMLEVPVMYYDIDAFKKAGLVPTVPQRSWMDLQGQLVTMANKGSRQCPLTSDLPVSINLENLAAVNNQLFASSENGLNGKGVPSFSFDSTYVRHLSLMISWVRSEIMVKPAFGARSVERFASGECAIMMSNSGHIGQFNDKRGLSYAVSGLPYYPEVTKTPGSPFISGSALWVTKATDKAQTKAVTQFLAWLAQPDQASTWHQETGYLPLTAAAFAKTPADYYKGLGQWRDLIAVYAKPAPPTGQGFRIHNYASIRAKFHEILDKALNGNQPAVTALRLAAAEANKLVQQR